MTTASNLKNLQVQQNKAIRSLFVINKRVRLEPYYKKARVLRVEDLTALSLIKFHFDM